MFIRHDRSNKGGGSLYVRNASNPLQLDLLKQIENHELFFDKGSIGQI